MPTLTDVLAFLSVMPTTTALIILALAASVMVAVRDWRLSIFALALHEPGFYRQQRPRSK